MAAGPSPASDLSSEALREFLVESYENLLGDVRAGQIKMSGESPVPS